MDTPEKVIAFLDKSHIERAVVVPVYSLEKERAFTINSLVLETAKKAPDRVVPGLWVDPSPKEREHLQATLRAAKDNGVYVLKTASQTWDSGYSPDPSTWDSAFHESMSMLLNFLRTTGSIIQMHTGSGKSDIRLIEKLILYAGPEVCFHLVHMGGNVNGHFYLIPRLLEWREKGLNVICDTSWAGGYAVRWIMDLARNNPTLRKCILFASDEPWGIFKSELAKVVDATEGKLDLLRDVLWKNAHQIYSR